MGPDMADIRAWGLQGRMGIQLAGRFATAACWAPIGERHGYPTAARDERRGRRAPACVWTRRQASSVLFGCNGAANDESYGARRGLETRRVALVACRPLPAGAAGGGWSRRAMQSDWRWRTRGRRGPRNERVEQCWSGDCSQRIGQGGRGEDAAGRAARLDGEGRYKGTRQNELAGLSGRGSGGRETGVAATVALGPAVPV